ncbi:DUF4249 domain-containing protein [Mariniphaga sediminis]|uniref:DUF4249 domain-containing protein n=1 Tax=Mariniphaga sediminis TaxID=1628158 RepID=UPI003565EBDB
MKFKSTFIILLVTAIFLSCEEDVSFDFEHEPRLCLNCILNPDSAVITASLSLSKMLDTINEIKTVNDAEILLYEEENLLGRFSHAGNGKFKLNKVPVSGKTYRITVDSEEYGKISASTIVPNKPEITWSKDTVGYDQYNSLRYNLNVQIHDKQGKNNYWLFSTGISRGIKGGGGGGVVLNAPFADTFNRRYEIEEKYGFIHYYQIRLSDEGYDGQILDFIIPDLVPTNQYRAKHILNASEHYDKYIKTSILFKLNEESDLPFNEPVQIYSNIENGFGIFGACSISTIVL